MSLVTRKAVEHLALGTVAPEVELIADGYFVGDAVAHGGKNLKEVYKAGKSAYRTLSKGVKAVSSGVKAINDAISGGDSRPPVVVSQMALAEPDRSVVQAGSLTKVPVAVNRVIQSKSPHMRTSPSGMRVTHRELVTDIESGGIAWNEAHFMELNPGLSHCFPWLSTIAKGFQQYRAIGNVRLEYVPSLATTSAGAIYMSPCYVADEDQPDSEAEAANLSGTVSGSVWAPLTLTLPNRSLMSIGPKKFVRTEMEAGDLKTFDMGFVQVSTVGAAAGVTGRLFVSYDIEFFNPIVGPSGTLGSIFGFAAGYGSNAGNVTLVNGVTQGFPVTTFYANGLRALVSAAGRYWLPRGRYLGSFSCSVFNSTGTGKMSLLMNGVAQGSNRVDSTVNSRSLVAATSVTDTTLFLEQNFLFEVFDSSSTIGCDLTITFGGGTNALLNNSADNFPKVYFTLL